MINYDFVLSYIFSSVKDNKTAYSYHKHWFIKQPKDLKAPYVPHVKKITLQNG